MKVPLRLVRNLQVSRKSFVMWDPVIGADGLYISDRDKFVLKFDLTTLEEVWRISAKRFDVVRAIGDLILLSSDAGLRRAIHPTGEVIWTLKTGRRWACWRDRLLVVGDSGVDVVDIGTGRTVGRLDLPLDLEFNAVWDDMLIVTTGEIGDPIRAYAPDSGRLCWERNILEEIRTTYGVGERFPATVFVRGAPGQYVMRWANHTFGGSLEDGRILWMSPMPVDYALPNVHEGRVYSLFGTALEPHLMAIEEATGRLVYNVPLQRYAEMVRVARAPDPSRLRPQPDYRPTLGRIMGGGIVLEDAIVFPSESGTLVAFRLSDGELVWVHHCDTSLYGGVTDGRRLYVAGDDGYLRVFVGADSTE